MENYFWTVVIIGSVVYLATRKKQPTLAVPEKIKEHVSHAEKESVEKKVRDRINEAEKKGMPDLAMKMFEECKYFPTWIQQTPRDWVPSFVTKATSEEVFNKYEEKEFRLKIQTINGEIEFRQGKTGSWDCYIYGEFSFLWEGHTVMTLALSKNRNSTDEDWKRFNIEGYIPGEWESLLKSLENSINHTSVLRNKAAQNDPTRINEIKKKFGL